MTEYLQNLHTHGPLCDGKTEYEDMVKRAVGLGFTSIGFSGHSHTPFDVSYCMTPEKTVQYKNHIKQLKEKYSGIIDIYCGIEFDMFSDDKIKDYDYSIGSVHYIKCDDEFIEIDPSSSAALKEIADLHFHGSGDLLAKAYFETIAELPKYANCDIVGHFDLISKHCQRTDVISEHSQIYKSSALEAITAVAEKIRIFEINVGAIARGYRSIPYPAPFLLKRLKELGCGVVISSDCHNMDYLNTNFDSGLNLAKECGFDEVLILTGNGFKGIKI